MGDNSAQFQSLHIAIHGVELVCTRSEVLVGRMKWEEPGQLLHEMSVVSGGQIIYQALCLKLITHSGGHNE